MTESNKLDGKWVSLEDRAVFRLSGPDRVRYLNGQVTSDVSVPLEEKSIAGCLCSLKGKVEALVWITAKGDSLLIDGQLDQRDDIFARLDRYLIADDCELHDETGNLRLIHHFDEQQGGARSRRSIDTGFDTWLDRDEESPFSESLEMSLEEFQIRQLRAAIPLSPFEITGAEFPAEIGLDTWAVNFQKGCYLGQEIISRIKSVGKVKRRLSLILADVPIDQNAKVRNQEKQESVATRPSKMISEKDYLSLAFFSSAGKTSETLVPQRVEVI